MIENPDIGKKSVAEGIYEEMRLRNDWIILTFTNESDENQLFKREVNNSYIQFHFCIKGSASFSFNDGNYRLPLNEGHSLLLYNPQRDLPIAVAVPGKSWVLSLLVPIKGLHSLFSREAGYISFLSDENKDRKYYTDAIIGPSMAIVLNQLLNYNLHPMVKTLYFEAKCLELMSLYFNRPAELDIEQCPFLADEENIAKIRKAKQIVLSRMAEPPSLKELATLVNLPINRLKEGFKQVYGDTVYSFLFDYKMEVARQLLVSGSHNVNEVGLKVGYSTASHFIAAFKKKYGTTPKRFLKGVTT